MLDATLAATATDDGIALSLRIENPGPEPVTLDFRTGQRAEFTAYPAAEEGEGSDADRTDPVWRDGAGRMFTQALGSETVASGESVGYEGKWRDPPPGTYRIVGEVTATDRDVRAETVVDLG
ncbi:hypothetical protein J2744_000359 [Halorubrum trapanicum]|uniref:Intracellular proteinase inhibitor BsuPI domain-containing protein n=1 Tax=Halorubrum trapanicum TaxID=29284 RepID=A0A8J7R6G5_9EURY|nr:BsuPI-related putative proteinase inhibitor [Halorubrum trapanicum]MBP1900707.1 hypothetical protein [Halorubrum trapanicum]